MYIYICINIYMKTRPSNVSNRKSCVTSRLPPFCPSKGSTSKRFPMAVRDAIESSSNHFSRICTWANHGFKTREHNNRRTIDTQLPIFLGCPYYIYMWPTEKTYLLRDV